MFYQKDVVCNVDAIMQSRWKGKVDLVDLALLDYVRSWCNKGKKIRISGREYIWISYGALLQAMPLLPIKSKASLARRFRQLQGAGILKIVVRKMRPYVHITKEFASVYFVQPRTMRDVVRSINKLRESFRTDWDYPESINVDSVRLERIKHIEAKKVMWELSKDIHVQVQWSEFRKKFTSDISDVSLVTSVLPIITRSLEKTGARHTYSNVLITKRYIKVIKQVLALICVVTQDVGAITLDALEQLVAKHIVDASLALGKSAKLYRIIAYVPKEEEQKPVLLSKKVVRDAHRAMVETGLLKEVETCGTC